MAANRIGKTEGAGGYETVLHLTGLYPEWWQGRRFSHGINAWAVGKTADTTRDILQNKLLGCTHLDSVDVGTGLIPADTIVHMTKRTGTPHCVQDLYIRHVSGDISVLTFKSYKQGRGAFEGTSQHVVWLDEEPPADVYAECLLRTMTVGGIVYVTFTPLEGVSTVVQSFLNTDKAMDRKKALITATWDDVPHLSEKQKKSLLAGIPEHEKEARALGVPTLGSGRIYTMPESEIAVAPFAIPPHWVQIVGMDFGWDHPTCAVRLAWDRDGDVVYVTHCHSVRHGTPPVHASAIKAWGDWLPVAWPHDGFQTEKGTGQTLRHRYEELGLNMLPHHATFEGGGTSVEAGILDMTDRMQSGRFRVFRNLSDWFDEYRLYHRRDGKVVKQNDDILDATRYGMMMIRDAIPPPSERTNTLNHADISYKPNY